MKTFVAITALLVGFLLFFIYASGRSERRAKFIAFMNDLKEAHYELQEYGSFTNQSLHSKIQPWTNSYVVGGHTYGCEFRGDRDEFINLGSLAITTNQIFIWIDKSGKGVPLITHDGHLTFPSGI